MKVGSKAPRMHAYIITLVVSDKRTTILIIVIKIIHAIWFIFISSSSSSYNCIFNFCSDLEEERQLGLFFGVILLGSIFALVGAGLSMYWLYRKTHPDAYRRSSLHDLQRLRSTSSTNDDVKKSMV